MAPCFADRDSRRRQATGALALVAAAVWWAVPAALAQQPGGGGAPGGEGGTYLSVPWLVFLSVCAAGWLYLTAWVSDDATGVGLRTRMWTTIMLGAGAVGLLLAFLVHAAMVLLMLPAVGGAFALYVRERNAAVPERFRLFAGRSAAAEPEGQEGAAAAEGRAAGTAARLELELFSEQGQPLADFVASSPEFAEVGQSLRDIVALGCHRQAWSMRIEPSPEGHLVLFNLEGVTQRVDTLEPEVGRALIACAARFLGITGRGRTRSKMTARMPGQADAELAVRGVKSRHGPALVLELPDWTADLYRGGLAALGMHAAMQERLSKLLEASGRVLVVSGPPASGKTTTFHALVGMIDIFTTDVTTFEQRLVHELDHVKREQVDLGSEATFRQTLARALREEPGVLAADEVTDLRVAGPLFEFADAGKRALLTVQAASAAEAVALLARAVEGELLSHTLACVVNQRLARKLCMSCREPVEPNPAFLARLRIDPQNPGTWFRAVGCEECLGTGYRGRTGLFEMLIVNEPLRRLLSRGRVQAAEVKAAAGQKALRTLYQDALLKVRQGVTTLEEVRRVLK